MGISVKGITNTASNLFKNENTPILMWFVSNMVLALTMNLLDIFADLFTWLFGVSIIFSFSMLSINLVLKKIRYIKLYSAQTTQMVKNKDFSKIEKTTLEKGIEAAEKTIPKPEIKSEPEKLTPSEPETEVVFKGDNNG